MLIAPRPTGSQERLAVIVALVEVECSFTSLTGFDAFEKSCDVIQFGLIMGIWTAIGISCSDQA